MRRPSIEHMGDIEFGYSDPTIEWMIDHLPTPVVTVIMAFVNVLNLRNHD